MSFAPDGRTLVTGEAVTGRFAAPEVIVLRDSANGRGAREVAADPGRAASPASVDGRSVLVSSGNARSRLLDARTLQRVGTLPTGGVAAVSPRRKRPRSGTTTAPSRSSTSPRADCDAVRPRRGEHPGACVQRRRQGARERGRGRQRRGLEHRRKRLGEIFQGHSAAASGVALSPDGKTLYSASFDGSVIVWDVTGERRLGKLLGFDPVGPAERATATEHHGSVALAVAVAPDGSLFATAPRPGRVTLWHSATLAPEARELRGPVGSVISLAFSTDGTLLAATGSTRHTAVWDVSTGKLIRTLTHPPSAKHIDGSGAVALTATASRSP